jgi:phosphate starvation-inducible protein PhoH and related proteins
MAKFRNRSRQKPFDDLACFPAKPKRQKKIRAEKVIGNPEGWNPPSHFQDLTPNHHRLIREINSKNITIANGPPGTLKTFLALKTAFNLVKACQYDKILYVRQNIQRPREKGLGYREGDEKSKLSPLLRPIEDNLHSLMPPGAVEYELRINRIEGSDMEMMRGRSPLNTIIIVDECQNIDFEGLKCVMTRVSSSSKLILLGDFKGQRDMNGRDFDAFEMVCKEFQNVPGIGSVTLTIRDILRNPMIAKILDGFDRIESRRKCDRPIRRNGQHCGANPN